MNGALVTVSATQVLHRTEGVCAPLSGSSGRRSRTSSSAIPTHADMGSLLKLRTLPRDGRELCAHPNFQSVQVAHAVDSPLRVPRSATLPEGDP